MKLFITCLIFLSLVQTTILPLNAVFIVLIVRSFITPLLENLWLAFIFGLLLAFLLGQPLGILSLIYLTAVFLVNLTKNLPTAQSFVSIILLTSLLVVVEQFIQSLVFSFQPHLIGLMPQLVLILPIFLLVKIWEERFVIKPSIKLRPGK